MILTRTPITSYILPVGVSIIEVKDSGTTTHREKLLYFTLRVIPPALVPAVGDDKRVSVSGLKEGASWQYRFTGQTAAGLSTWSSAITESSVLLPQGVYSKTALKRLRVRQDLGGYQSREVELSPDALAATPTFVVGTLATSHQAWQIASTNTVAENKNRLVLPPELAAQSVAFWVRSHTSSGFNTFFSAHAAADVQLFYEGSKLTFWRDLAPYRGGVSVDQATPLNWHHYLVVKSGITVTFYRDGQQLWAERALNVAAEFAGNAIHKIVFGNDVRNPVIQGNWQRQFNGLIKGIQLWDKTFNPTEALALYKQGPDLPSDVSQLVAFYPLQDDTVSDVVAGGQTLSAITFAADNLHAPGVIGGLLLTDGRLASTLAAESGTFSPAAGTFSYTLAPAILLKDIPPFATISWIADSPGTVAGSVLQVTAAGSVRVSARHAPTFNHAAPANDSVTITVNFSQADSTLNRAAELTPGYVFYDSNDRNGRTAAQAIAVEWRSSANLVGPLVAGSLPSLESLVRGGGASLSYSTVTVDQAGVINKTVPIDSISNYKIPVGVSIIEVKDRSTATHKEKLLYFTLRVIPPPLVLTVGVDKKLSVSGLAGAASWEYSLDGGATWNAAGTATSATLTLGIYSKSALKRLRVRQTQNGQTSAAVALSDVALPGTPTFVQGNRVLTDHMALRIATTNDATQARNRLVLPPGLAAKSVAFWARATAVSGTNVLLSASSPSPNIQLELRSNNSGSDQLFFSGTSQPLAQSLNWHHYLLVKDGAHMVVYLDGTQVLEARNLPSADMSGLVLGNLRAPATGLNPFNGFIKGVQLWDQTFDADGARALYNQGRSALPEDISQLVAFYPLRAVTISDAVVGGQTLNTIDPASDPNPTDPGVRGAVVADGRQSSTLAAKSDPLGPEAGQLSYLVSAEKLLSGIPPGVTTISWTASTPSTGATTGTVELEGGANGGTVRLEQGSSRSLTTTKADGAVELTASHEATFNYQAASVTMTVTFSKLASSLTRASDATTSSGYVFDVRNNKDGRSATQAIEVQQQRAGSSSKADFVVQEALRVDQLVQQSAGGLSYQRITVTNGEESGSSNISAAQAVSYTLPQDSVGLLIIKVTDSGSDTVLGKSLYFRLAVKPQPPTFTVTNSNLTVGLADGVSWQYSLNSNWDADKISTTNSVLWEAGIYSRPALSRLRVRQQVSRQWSDAATLSQEALAATPAFTVGPRPVTSQVAWRVADSHNSSAAANRLVLPPQLAAQSVAFWARVHAFSSSHVSLLFSARESADIQLYFKQNGSLYLWDSILGHALGGVELVAPGSSQPRDWDHYLLVKSGTTISVYRNGQALWSDLVIAPNDDRMTRIVFGNDDRSPATHGQNRQFNGLIKGVQLWDKTFSSTQAEALYGLGEKLPDDISQLLAFYPFNEGSLNPKDAVSGGLPLQALSASDLGGNLFGRLAGAWDNNSRIASPLAVKISGVRVAPGELNYLVSTEELLRVIPPGVNLDWSHSLPISGANSGIVSLAVGPPLNLSTTKADGAVLLTVTHPATFNYLAGSLPITVSFTKKASNLTKKSNADSGAVYKFSHESGRDGSSVALAIVVTRADSTPFIAGTALPLEQLVKGQVGTLSYHPGSQASVSLEAANDQPGFQYAPPAGNWIVKVSDSGSATVAAKSLYFTLAVTPLPPIPTVANPNLTVSGLAAGASWQYSLDSGSSWSAEFTTTSTKLPDGIYNKTALSRLQVRQKLVGLLSTARSLPSADLEALAAFVVGTPPSTGPIALRIATTNAAAENKNRLVLPSELAAQTVAFWARAYVLPIAGQNDLSMLFSAIDSDIQLYLQPNGALALYDTVDTSGTEPAPASISPQPYEWHHYLVVKAADKVSVYRDGQAVWSDLALKPNDNAKISKLVFGNDVGDPDVLGRNWKRQFNGLIKGIQLWDRVFTAPEASTLYQLGGALPIDPAWRGSLVAFYPLQDSALADEVAGGQRLHYITFNAANLYTPGVVGGMLVSDGRAPSPLRYAIGETVTEAADVAQLSYPFAPLLARYPVPAGMNIDWALVPPAPSEVSLDKTSSPPTLRTTKLPLAAEVTASHPGDNFNYLAGSLPITVRFTQRDSTLTRATAAPPGYVFDESTGKNGSSADLAIVVTRADSTPFIVGTTLRLDQLVQGDIGTLSYYTISDGHASTQLVDPTRQGRIFQYTPPVGNWTVKVSDSGSATVAAKSLHFTLAVHPLPLVPTLAPTLAKPELRVSGLVTGASWQYSLDEGNSWSDGSEVAASSSTASIELPGGIYSKTTFNRLQVRQQVDGLLSAVAPLSAQDKASAAFVVGTAPATGQNAWRIASTNDDPQAQNRLVLPPHLAAKSISFWARAYAISGGNNMLLSVLPPDYIQLSYNATESPPNVVLYREIYVAQELPNLFNWHHFLLVKTPTNVTLYADGKWLITKSFTDSADMSKIVFGNDDRDAVRQGNWNCEFNGLIKGIQLWDRVFTAEEASTLYQLRGALTSDPALLRGLVAFYPLQDSTLADVVAGGRRLHPITFDPANLHAPGVVGGQLIIDGRAPSPLRMVDGKTEVTAAVGVDSYSLAPLLQANTIPAGVTPLWTLGSTNPNGSVTLNTSPPTLTANPPFPATAVVSATHPGDNFNYLAGSLPITVILTKKASAMTQAADATSGAGYKFSHESNLDGSTAAKAIKVWRYDNTSFMAGTKLRLDTLVTNSAGTLRFYTGTEADLGVAVQGVFEYLPTELGDFIVKVTDAGSDRVEGRWLFFRFDLKIPAPTIAVDQWDGIHYFVANALERTDIEVKSSYAKNLTWGPWKPIVGGDYKPKLSDALPVGVYNKQAWSRKNLWVQQRVVGYSPSAITQAEGIRLVGDPQTTNQAWRIASDFSPDTRARLVLPPALTAQSVSFWFKAEELHPDTPSALLDTRVFNVLLSVRESIDIQLYLKKEVVSGSNKTYMRLATYSDHEYVNYPHMTEVPLGQPMEQGLWYHIIVIKASNSTAIRVFWASNLMMPGIEVGSNVYTNRMSKLVFGNDDRSNQTGRQFKGLIRGIQLWDKALNQQDINLLYGSEVARYMPNAGYFVYRPLLPRDAAGLLLLDHLVAYYPLQGNWNDLVGHGTTLTQLSSFNGANPYAPGVVSGTFVYPVLPVT